MSWATKLIITVLGGLIAYYLSDTFLTGIILGTTTADEMLKSILPITIAGAVVIAIVTIGFKAG